MNSLYKNNVNRLLVALLICSAQLLPGCSKDKQAEIMKPAGDGTQLVVSVLGVTDADETTPSGLKANAAIKPAIKQSAVLPNKMLSFKDFDAVLEVERNVAGNSKVLIKDASQKNAGAGLLAAAVAEGVVYRLMLYKADGKFVSSTLLTSGKPAQLRVETGTTYNWYAVSYNSKDAIPEVDTLATALVLPGGKDVLYASGRVSIPEEPGSDTPLGIIFKHSLARIAVELNTMGMFADMVSAGLSVAGVPVKTATLNLKTGALSNLVDYTQRVEYANFSNVDSAYSDRKIAYIYTANAAAINNLTVSVNALALTLDDRTTRTFAALATTPSVFTFNLTPQLGASFTARVNLIESPLTLDGVRWSRQNLYYQAGRNPYRFHHTYAHTNARNTYFSFGALTPDSYGLDSDPCALVYPQGVWRQASEADFRTLVGTAIGGFGAEASTYNTVGGLGYIEYPGATGTAGPYPGNDLRFNMNGQGVAVSLLGNNVTIDLGQTFGGSANYWTSTPLLDALGLLRTGAYQYQASANTRSLSTSLLNISLLGNVEVAQTNFRNIRCVRR